jgi:ABC-type branched-subunit amino acid transport system substrate-binding protein
MPVFATGGLIGNQALGVPEYIQLAGPAAEGVMHVNTSSSHINPHPKVQAFARRYETKFKRVRSISSVNNYNGVMVIAETIKLDSKGQGTKGAIVIQASVHASICERIYDSPN